MHACPRKTFRINIFSERVVVTRNSGIYYGVLGFHKFMREKLLDESIIITMYAQGPANEHAVLCMGKTYIVKDYDCDVILRARGK